MIRNCALLTLLSLASACARDHDPCPRGFVKSRMADLCVAIDRSATDASTHDEAGAPPDRGPGLDAGADADPGDAAVIRDTGRADAAEGGGVTPACSAEDVGAWRALHLSDTLTQSIAGCVAADPACRTGRCPLDVCLRQKAGVAACEACVQDEVECVTAQCAGPCSQSGSDSECRACACAKGCVTMFGRCAGNSLGVCADCNGTTCAGMSSLAPELIMVVVQSLLMDLAP